MTTDWAPPKTPPHTPAPTKKPATTPMPFIWGSYGQQPAQNPPKPDKPDDTGPKPGTPLPIKMKIQGWRQTSDGGLIVEAYERKKTK